ncbi:MAG: adenylate/guanylate cyclase domain-containing protein [Calditrichaeota bacterium]|nr:adenylate/guanylate cyclase domain-containing protein [Calditrichota bacterium]
MAQKQKKESLVMVFAISIGAIILAYLIGFSSTIHTLELKFIDMRFGLRGPIELEDSPVVIVKIDDQSDESTPERWPWPRAYFAQVIKNLNAAGAAVIGVDVIFDQPDVDSTASDQEFAEVLRQYDNVVLAGKILRSQNYSTIYPPYQKFITDNNNWGLVAVEADLDGFYRRYLVTDTYNDSLYPSFVAEILRKYSGHQDNFKFENNPDNFVVGDLRVPKFTNNSMMINYYGPAFTFPSYSFDYILDSQDFDMGDFDSDLFDDPGDPELGIPPGIKYTGQLKDKIVLIGATMFELHDLFPTPFLEVKDSLGNQSSVEMPGVELHANALMTILQKNFLTQTPFLLNILIILAAVILTFIITRFLPTLWSSIGTIFLVAVYIAITVFVFVNNNVIMEIVNPVLIIAFSYVGHTLYHYLQTQQEKKMLRGAFAHYVPEKVVQELMNNPEKLQLGGEERVISVIFSDVAGFTSISEKLTPRELVLLLNEYLTAMTNIVLDHNGIIDKYEGDAIMAEFGMPVAFDDHPQAACRAALQMQTRLEEMRKKWKAEGRPELEARVGINTGEVIVGNMGSESVFDYTVMGDHVNLGSRLEGANKVYGTKIMISEFTYAFVKNDFYTRPLDLIRVKGKNKPIEVFELIAERNTQLESKYLEMLSAYHKGIEAYRTRNWKEAIDSFEFCLNLYPEDYPSKLYRKRSIEFKFNDPGENWDGVFTMTTK